MIHLFKTIFYAYINGHDRRILFENPILNQDDLESNGYELAGDIDGFHFYEKVFLLSYLKRDVEVLFKRYFFKNKEHANVTHIIGSIPLISPINLYMKNMNSSKKIHDIEFYLAHDELDGAIIIDDKIILKFYKEKTCSYFLSLIEFSDDKESNKLGVTVVRYTLNKVEFKDICKMADRPFRYFNKINDCSDM